MRSKPNPLTVKAMGKPTSRKSTVTFAQPEQHHGRRHSAKGSLPQQPSLSRTQRLRNFLLRLPVAVSLIYFLFLVCVGIIINVSTRIVTGKAVFETWRDTHALQVQSVSLRIDAIANRMRNITVTAAAFYADSPNPVESNKTLTMLCATLDITDKKQRVRALALGSFAVSQYASCVHGDLTDPSPTNLTAIASDKGNFYGVSYINPATYTYYDPNIPKGITGQTWSMAYFIESFKPRYSIFKQLDLLAEGAISSIDPRYCWGSAVNEPNYLSYIVPVASLGLSSNSRLTVYPTDFAQTRITGATLLDTLRQTNDTGYMRAMVLVNRSLAFDDPQVLSLNWNQELVLNPSFVSFPTNNTTYLTVSQINDPLIKEAAKRVDFKALQREGYKKTQYFSYRGAPAAITAYVYTNANGLTLPVVVVSPQRDVSGPYMLINNISTGMVAAAVVLMTGLCYFAMDRYLARPLRRLTAAMLASLRRSVRQPVRADPCDVVQLTETRELTQAYNAAMAQLRLVDEFVPTPPSSLRGSKVRKDELELQQQYLTIVTVRIRSSAAAGQSGVDTTTILQQHAHDARRERFAAFVNAVAVANTQMTSSGPFASPAALAAFVCAVRELCVAHHGTVHRLTPDSCVLHFASAVRTCMARQQRHPSPSLDSVEGVDGDGATDGPAAAGVSADVEACATADARAAVDFALGLQQWVEEQRAAAAETGEHGGEGGGATPAGPPSAAAAAAAAAAVPDVRVLVDTGVFTCGQYRADALEQTLSVALGRDAERAVGGVAAQIGVRVALTEETAVRVRGVRQIPVEALHTGRSGLDADVIILYEALPGPVAGDAAWQQYARCCFDGFAAMVDGDYAGALRCYRSVAEIAELEPGLLPRCVSREAAASSVVGGAVSTQVARLIAECEVRVGRGCTEGFARRRVVPFGVDALLPRGEQRALRARNKLSVNVSASEPASGTRSSLGVRSIPSSTRKEVLRGLSSPVPLGSGVSPWRYVVSVNTAVGAVRRVLGGRPDWIQDNYGLYWYLRKRNDEATAASTWMQSYTALGSAGGLATVTKHLLREARPDFSSKVDAAPIGPMSDELRSAVPIRTVSDATRNKVQLLLELHNEFKHPNILRPLTYSFSVEGCLTVMWEFCPSGTLRDIVNRYPSLRPLAFIRFGFSILSGLSYLHARGRVHGSLCLDLVSVGADGVCRLFNRHGNYHLDNEVFVVPQSCYLSPAMAALEAPTPACDMFCYGLLCLEAVTREPGWAWATMSEGSVHPSEEELKLLMSEGGAAFCKAVVDGDVVPNLAALERMEVADNYNEMARQSIRDLLSYDASKRPTAEDVWEVSKLVLQRCGFVLSDGDERGL